MLSELNVPQQFVRNHPNIARAGALATGKRLIHKTTEYHGLYTLEDKRILDVGCGTRFTATFINGNIPIRSYTGIDVDKSIIGYLKDNVEAQDVRFDYAHWDVVNVLYNNTGSALDTQSELPIDQSRKFDLIWMFSVITHQYPDGSSALFNILKNHVAPDGRMFFTAFVDAGVDKFMDVLPDQPLMMAYFQREYLEELLDDAGWKVEKHVPADPGKPPLHQDGFLCAVK